MTINRIILTCYGMTGRHKNHRRNRVARRSAFFWTSNFKLDYANLMNMILHNNFIKQHFTLLA